MAKPHKQIDQYVKDETLSTTQRAAHFLDWAAKQAPKEFFPYNVIYKAIMGMPHMPRLDNEAVALFKRTATAGLRKALVTKYDREVINLVGVGIRASVDDADRLTNVAPMKARRLDSARRSFMLTAASIDLHNVPNTPAYAALKAWMGREVRDVIKQIGSPEFAMKLLPPDIEPKNVTGEK